jgi:dihydrolipoamide dehydrogenase
VRLLYETKYNQVLGVQIIGHHATDMIAEAGILMQLEGTVFDLARTIHAHPTIRKYLWKRHTRCKPFLS